jgi:hypothetical protein
MMVNSAQIEVAVYFTVNHVFCSKGAGNAGAATIKRNQEICTSESEI